MERLCINTEIKNAILEFVYETGGGPFFEFAIIRDYQRLRLWVNSTQYGRVYEICDKKISEESANKMFDLVFPISKWEIARPESIMVDGNYFQIAYHGDCEVVLASSSFNLTAVNDMIATLVTYIECQ